MAQLEDHRGDSPFLALYTFLGLNGYDLEAPEEEAVHVMTAVADGTLDEEGLAGWPSLGLNDSREMPVEASA